MANVPISNMTATWTDSGTTYTGIKMNVTDTASAAASLLADLQVGGTSKFKVDKAGKAVAATGDNATGGFRFAGIENVGMYVQAANIGAGSNVLALRSTNGIDVGISSAQFRLHTGIVLGWASGDPTSTAADTILARDAANTLAQRNATNAQTFRVYNTYTDASNYERAFVQYASNVLQIGHEAAGTGTTARVVRFFTGGLGYFNIGATNLYLSLESNRTFAIPAGSGSIEFTEAGTTITAPAANKVKIYAEDDGAGKTRLMALFATGAAQQIAIEP